jgi:hypothetical protein
LSTLFALAEELFDADAGCCAIVRRGAAAIDAAKAAKRRIEKMRAEKREE